VRRVRANASDRPFRSRTWPKIVRLLDHDATPCARRRQFEHTLLAQPVRLEADWLVAMSHRAPRRSAHDARATWDGQLPASTTRSRRVKALGMSTASPTAEATV